MPSQPVLAFHSDIIAGTQQCVASRPAAADRCSHFLDHVSHINWQNRVAHQSSDHTRGLSVRTVWALFWSGLLGDPR